MKKTYIIPFCEVCDSDLYSMIAASPTALISDEEFGGEGGVKDAGNLSDDIWGAAE